MAALPGWEIAVPGHPDELEHVLRRAAAADGRIYLRMAEDTNARAFGGDLRTLQVVRHGAQRAPIVVAVGPMLSPTLEATKGMDLTILYAVTVRPWDAATLRQFAHGTEIILVEPYLAGTSTAEVAAILHDRPHRTLAIGVGRDDLRRYGTRSEHHAAQGLDGAGIRRSISRFLDGADTPRPHSRVA
jgi:transketolase